MAQFATVAAITGNGTVFAVDAQGHSRVLHAGDSLQKGETVRTVGDVRVELIMEDGHLLAVAPAQSVRLDENVVESEHRPTAQDSAITTPATAETVIQALERGGDLSVELEATAAGLAPGGAVDGGITFVQLLRITEGVTPLSYNYSFTETGLPPEQQAQPQPAATTTLQLTADPAVFEGSDGITYTATLGIAGTSDMTITLSNGVVIVIPAGSTTGSNMGPVQGDDIYKDGETLQTSVSTVQGGGFISLTVDDANVITVVNDTIDLTAARVSVSVVDEAGHVVEGNPLTFRFSVDNAPQTDLKLNVTIGGVTQEVTIAAGTLHTDVTVDTRPDEFHVQGNAVIIATVDSVNPTADGNFEKLDYSGASVSATVVDDSDKTIATLSGNGQVDAGGSIVYTVTLDHPVLAGDAPVVVTLSNGLAVTIAAGTTGTATDPAPVDGSLVGIEAITQTPTAQSPGSFEQLQGSGSVSVDINYTPGIQATDTGVDETGGLDTVTGTLAVDWKGDGAGSLSLSAAGATWTAATQTLAATDGSWQVVVNNDGTYTFTQLKPMTHGDTTNPDDALTLTITANATDADGSLASQDFTVTVKDDGPVANDLPGATYAEGSGTHDLGAALATLGISGGEDGVQSIVFGTGNRGGALSIDGSGHLLYTSPTSVSSSSTVTESFSYTVTDGDGDTVTKTVTFGVSDTGITNVSATNVSVDEDDIAALPAGNPGGAGDMTTPVPTGHLSYTLGADALQSIALSVTSTGLTKLDGTTTVNTSWDAATKTLTGYGGTDTTDVVFSIVLSNVTASGADYTLTLYQPVQHPGHDDPSTTGTVETSFEDDKGFTVGVTVLDADNSPGTTSFTVTINDDTPIIISATDIVTYNHAGYSGTGSFVASPGADGIGGYQFSGFTDGDQGVVAGGLLMTANGGSPVYLFGAGTNVLHGTLSADGTGDSVFTVTIHQDGTYEYDVNLLDALDSITLSTLANLGSLGISGGNGAYFVVGSSTTSSFEDDVLITSVQPNGTVNRASNDLGTDNQWVSPHTGLRFDFVNDIHTNGTYVDHRSLTGVAVGLASVQPTGGGQPEADVILGLYSGSSSTSTGTSILTSSNYLSVITSISYKTMDASGHVVEMKFDTPAEIQAAVAANQIGFATGYDTSYSQGQTTIADQVSGLVVYDVLEHTSVTVTTNVAFDAVEAVNYNGYNFSVNSISAAYISTEPVSFDLQFVAVDGDGDKSAAETFTITANPVVEGTAGNDQLYGGSGDDLIMGGQGNDILSGGLGADVFKWNLNDQGTTTTPAVDHIKDFTVAQGDALNLADLLLGEHNGTGGDTSNLTQYLQFGVVSGKLVLSVDHDGGTFATDQNIVFDNFSSKDALATALGLASGSSDADILAKMIHDGHLKTDI